MSAEIIKFPREAIKRRGGARRAIDCYVRQVRRAIPGKSPRWYWDVVRTVQGSFRMTIEEALTPSSLPAHMADAYQKIREKNQRRDTCEVLAFPLSRGQRDDAVQNATQREG